MHSKQGWKEKTPEGIQREIRVHRLGVHWRFQSRLKGVEEWTLHDPPDRRDVESLLDMLRRKYNRRRCSLRDVENIEALLQTYEPDGNP